MVTINVINWLTGQLILGQRFFEVCDNKQKKGKGLTMMCGPFYFHYLFMKNFLFKRNKCFLYYIYFDKDNRNEERDPNIRFVLTFILILINIFFLNF